MLVEPRSASAAAHRHVAVGPERGVAIRYLADDVAGVDSFGDEICDTRDTCTTAQMTTVGTSGCRIVGTGGDDVLSGTAGADVICSLGGDDVLYGLGDDVVIYGLGVDDVLVGGGENDVLWGGARHAGDDTVHGGPGRDILTGGNGRRRHAVRRCW